MMVYDAVEEPTIIFKGGWYTVTSNDSLSADFIAGFTYDDIIETLTAQGVQLADMDYMFLSATAQPVTIYGLYAVPVKSAEIIKGDVNGDGDETVADIVMLQQFLVNMVSLTYSQMKAADYNGDGVVNVFDVTAMRASYLTYEVDGY